MCHCFIYSNVRFLWRLKNFLSGFSVCGQNHQGWGSLPETVGGYCRCLKNIFTAGFLLSGQTPVPSIIASPCGPSPKAPISEYNWGSLINGQAPSVWCYFFAFSAMIIFSSEVLSMICSGMLSGCSWLKTLVPYFLNLPLIYLIHLARV